MKISFITTVYNEELTIREFLGSLMQQTNLPHEIIIVDGGSTDYTVKKINQIKFRSKNYKGKFNITVKAGNRSVGRNEAIKYATGDIIVCSDSGNILDKDWIKNIIKPFADNKVDVVAGYYKGKAETIFQKCVIPYALVMEDKIDPKEFLPATRSIAFRKSAWEKTGKFDESLSHNEDYVFARKLKETGAKIVFAKNAVVYWLPRNNLRQTFTMLWRFAFGDAEAGILRTTVLLLFTRYFIGLYFIFLCILYRSVNGAMILLLILLCYILWSIQKNYRYVKNKKAFYILPVLQFTADFAVLSGTLLGLLKRLKKHNPFTTFKNNKFLIGVLFIYSALMLMTLQWGIPSSNHPFPYHMDEWHQLQAVGNTFRYGTPNTEGSANGTMFHFVLSGFYLIPFTLIQYIDPFNLQIDNFVMREKMFEVLRLQTILFGILSIVILYKIASLLEVSKKIAILLFTFTPIWLMLSGYFKYDIALTFWILFSIYFFLRFANEPSNKNFVLAAIPASLAITVKISAVPLFVLYVISFFLFQTNWKSQIKYFFIGIGVFAGVILLFGMPDTLFGKGNMYDYFYSNVVTSPRDMTNFQIGMHPLLYLFIFQYPILFGHGLFAAFILSVIYFVVLFIKSGLKQSYNSHRIIWFLFISIIAFTASLIPLQLYGGGNRSLVLLPFIVLIIVFAWKLIVTKKNFRYISIGVLSIVIGIQIYESYSWIYMRTVPSPQRQASEWIQNNIKRNTNIGIENIPIYQNLPDLIQKEFYFKNYDLPYRNIFTYTVIDAKQKTLPQIIVITNGTFDTKYYGTLPKKSLVERIEKEGYKKEAEFKPDFRYYKIFGNEKDFYFSWLIATPLTTTVYRK